MEKVINYYKEGFEDNGLKMDKISYLQELKMDLIYNKFFKKQRYVSKRDNIDLSEVLITDIIELFSDSDMEFIYNWGIENIDTLKNNPYYTILSKVFFFVRNFLAYRESLKKK